MTGASLQQQRIVTVDRLECTQSAFANKPRLPTSTAAIVGAVLGLALGSSAVPAQTAFPSQPLEIFVGFPAGTSVDMVARSIGDKLQQSLGQPVLIKNMPGASGNLATEAAAKSAPDGHKLVLAGNASIVVNQHLFDKLGYNPATDLVPISQVAITPNVLVVHPSVPAKTLQEFVSFARAQQDGVTYAHVGAGTSQHLAGVLLASTANFQLRHIPYRGGGAALYSDLTEGRVSACFCNIVGALPFIRDGKLTALAVSTLQRSTQAPEIPTLGEAGFPLIDTSPWFGFMAPAGTPATVIEKLHREIQNALSPDVRASFEKLGVIVVSGNSPSQFAATIKSESAFWAKIIKDNGVKAQQ